MNTEDRGYAYDAAWNLNWRTNGTTPSQFNVNSLNELTSAPKPVGTLTYDNNGNLVQTENTISPHTTSVYSYDDENRLIQLIRTNSDLSATLTQFYYDGLGRLRERLEYVPPIAFSPIDGWTLSSETHYIYDGWRVIQERDGSNNPLVSYTRGNDLSGSMEGAGGIGGLLARSDGYSSGNFTTHSYYFDDGNGNVTYMLNSSQSMVASYRYDPFGNTISSSGTLASDNVYRFSSKEIHANSGMYYYGYRFYDSNLQRWINRDPLGDEGFQSKVGYFQTLRHQIMTELSLYQFVSNDPLRRFDPLGLSKGILGIPGTGGTCCNKSGKDTFYVDDGVWHMLPDGQCTPPSVDCDGYMCEGKFRPVSDMGKGTCTPNCLAPSMPLPNPRAPTPPPPKDWPHGPIAGLNGST